MYGCGLGASATARFEDTELPRQLPDMCSDRGTVSSPCIGVVGRHPGLGINTKKCRMQSTQFLGMPLDARAGVAKLTKKRQESLIICLSLSVGNQSYLDAFSMPFMSQCCSPGDSVQPPGSGRDLYPCWDEAQSIIHNGEGTSGGESATWMGKHSVSTI